MFDQSPNQIFIPDQGATDETVHSSSQRCPELTHDPYISGVSESPAPAHQGLAEAQLQSVCRFSRSSFWCSQLWTADSQSERPARSSQPVPVSPL